MSTYLFLLPISLGLGLIGLVTFLWTLKDNQYEDLNGARQRILYGDDKPIVNESEKST
ncbi:MAG: cbb3-type cytochrome oxidase assembly protein CcoS [Granulosicoccus sp.]